MSEHVANAPATPPKTTALACRIDRLERLIALLYTLPLETGWSYQPAIRAITKEIALEKNPTAESGRSGHR